MITDKNQARSPKMPGCRLQEGRINERIIGNTFPLSPERKKMHLGFHIQI